MAVKQQNGSTAPDGSQYVTISDGNNSIGSISTTTLRSTSAAQTSVASSTSDNTILASNANRLGASVYNESTSILYLLLASGTASNSNYSVQLASSSLYEAPFSYTGVIKGIWATANGNARVTEYS
jgi:hypothetical protein